MVSPISKHLLILLAITLGSCKRAPADSPAAAQTAAPPHASATGDWIGFHGGGPLLGDASAIGAPPMKVRWKFRAADEQSPASAGAPANSATGAPPATAPATEPAFRRPGRFEGSAAIVQGVAYVADTAGALYAIDLKTGKPRWTWLNLTADGSATGFETTPLVIDGRVMLGDLDGIFHAVAADTGKPLWSFDGGASIHSSANHLGEKRDRIVFGDDGADIYCLDAAAGKKLWEQKSGDRVNGAPAVSNGSALVSGCDAQLRAFKGSNGKQEFETDLGALCPGSAAVAGDRLVMGTDQGHVVCISATTHKPLWTFSGIGQEAMVYSSPAVADGIVAFGARDRNVYGVDLTTGKKLWNFATRGDVDSSPAISGGRVYIASKDKKLYVLDLKTGKEIWSFTAGRGITASPAIAQGVLVIGDSGGNLFCLEPG
ncbi:MAG TPA: PQQ-binding-like beta-propeller repeat protein [Tepidisphaeraceae bacterium]|nr:PQQ-binding-like beta-propeller repeat protein [Tepidisphaeraceae bacterium]